MNNKILITSTFDNCIKAMKAHYQMGEDFEAIGITFSNHNLEDIMDCVFDTAYDIIRLDCPWMADSFRERIINMLYDLAVYGVHYYYDGNVRSTEELYDYLTGEYAEDFKHSVSRD